MSQSFNVPGEKLEPFAIAELLKSHPGALPINVEWHAKGSKAWAIVWWIPPPKEVTPTWGGARRGSGRPRKEKVR